MRSIANAHSHIDDVRGASRLAVEATGVVTALVEKMHVTMGGHDSDRRSITSSRWPSADSESRIVSVAFEIERE